MSLEAIAAAAVQQAQEAGTLPPPASDSDVDFGADSGADTDADISADSSDATADAATDASATSADSSADAGAGGDARKWPESFSAEHIKVLEELGYNPPQKDNRMPYSKSLRQIAEGVLKARTKDSEAVTKREAEFKTKQDKLDAFDRMQQLANTDGEGFIRSLAAQRPDLYGRFLEAKRDDAATPKAERTPAQVERAADLEPQPDVKYDDGSVGYSAAQFQSHNQWLIREGKRQATEEFDKRLRPIEERERAVTARAKLQEQTQAQDAKAFKHWGKLYEDNKEAILAAMQADDAKAPIVGRTKEGRPIRKLTPFLEIVHDVLMPLKETALSADRNKVREEVLKELDERKAAAAPKRAAVQTTDDDLGDAPQTSEQIVAREVAKARKAGRL